MPGKGPRKYGTASLPEPKPKRVRVPKVASTDFPLPPSMSVPKSGKGPKVEQRKPLPKVKLNLQLEHSINGQKYGPGPVIVDENLANMFMDTERMCYEKEISLQQQQAFIIRMGRNGPVKMQVPWAQFDTILSREELPMQSIHQTL